MKTRNWSASIDLMPPGPARLHVTGEVYASNPGVKPLLTVATSQGINPAILVLDFRLPLGNSKPQDLMIWVRAEYNGDVAPGHVKYTHVEIVAEGKPIKTVPVEEVH